MRSLPRIVSNRGRPSEDQSAQRPRNVSVISWDGTVITCTSPNTEGTNEGVGITSQPSTKRFIDEWNNERQCRISGADDFETGCGAMDGPGTAQRVMGTGFEQGCQSFFPAPNSTYASNPAESNSVHSGARTSVGMDGPRIVTIYDCATCYNPEFLEGLASSTSKNTTDKDAPHEKIVPYLSSVLHGFSAMVMNALSMKDDETKKEEQTLVSLDTPAENKEMVLGSESNPLKRSRCSCFSNSRWKCWILFCVSVPLIVASTVAIINVLNNDGSATLATDNVSDGHLNHNNNTNETSAIDNPNGCTPGTIESSRSLTLEIHLSRLDRLANDSESVALEAAVIEGFNQVSGGCYDEYRRWMYNATLVNQTLIHEMLLQSDDNSTVLDNETTTESILLRDGTVAGATTLVFHFELSISCAGCSIEEAFASQYPQTFWSPATRLLSIDKAVNQEPNSLDDRNNRLRHQMGDRFTNSGRELDQPSNPLDAGKIVEEVQKNMMEVLPQSAGIKEATITYRRSDDNISKELTGEFGDNVFEVRFRSYFHQYAVYAHN
jgi:hypothetical protein